MLLAEEPAADQNKDPNLKAAPPTPAVFPPSALLAPLSLPRESSSSPRLAEGRPRTACPWSGSGRTEWAVLSSALTFAARAEGAAKPLRRGCVSGLSKALLKSHVPSGGFLKGQ